jgi:nucleoside-diphosphate-sugar epimerase
LAQGIAFDCKVNSKTISDIEGQTFDLVINCGVSAEKWRANQNPDADRAGIERLVKVLRTIKARRVVHISTVDVFGRPDGADETQKPIRDGLHPYGTHRLELEDFMQATFAQTQIVRLPGLFGPGLKKNAIFDLMTNNAVERITPNALMQWYPMRRLVDDIKTVMTNDVKLVHLTSEPVKTEEIVAAFFPRAKVGPAQAQAPYYDFRSRYAGLFGGSGGYILNRNQVLDEVGRFVRAKPDA